MPWAQPPGKRVGISNRLTPYKDHPRRTRRDKKEIHEGHEGPRRDTKTDGPPSTTSGAKMLLQFCALGVTMSWDEGFPGARASRPHDDGFPGARASRPHQAWHRLGHLPHLDQPGTAPWLSFGLADGVPADRVAACSIALKLSGGQRDRMRAGRPHSQGNHSPLEGESQKPSRQAKADAVGGGRRATSQRADVHPLGNSRLPASRAPAPGPGGSLESETTDYCGLSGARTLSGEAGWRQNILFFLSIHVNQGSTHARRRDPTTGFGLGVRATVQYGGDH